MSKNGNSQGGVNDEQFVVAFKLRSQQSLAGWTLRKESSFVCELP